MSNRKQTLKKKKINKKKLTQNKKNNKLPKLLQKHNKKIRSRSKYTGGVKYGDRGNPKTEEIVVDGEPIIFPITPFYPQGLFGDQIYYYDHLQKFSFQPDNTKNGKYLGFKNFIFLDSKYNTISQNRESPIHQFILDLPEDISSFYTYNSELGYKASNQPNPETIYSVTLLKTNDEALLSLPVLNEKQPQDVEVTPYKDNITIQMISQLDNEPVNLTGKILLKKLSTKQQLRKEKEYYMDNLSLFLVIDDENVYRLTIDLSSLTNFGDGLEWSSPLPLSPDRSHTDIMEVLSQPLKWNPESLFGYVPNDPNMPIIILANS